MKITIKIPSFYSEIDELSFMDILCQLSSSPPIGIGENISLTLKKSNSRRYITNVFGLFARYNISMNCLMFMITEKNKDYILNNQSYWYKSLTQVLVK